MKNILIILTFLFVTGCSISPLRDVNQSGEANIDVDIIANREGQQLHRMLKNALQNIGHKNYRLTVKLRVIERPFAETTEKNAQRIERKYIAHAILKDDHRKIVLEDDFIATTSNNISSGHGDVVYSLYGRNNRDLIKELCFRIVEAIRIFIKDEK